MEVALLSLLSVLASQGKSREKTREGARENGEKVKRASCDHDPILRNCKDSCPAPSYTQAAAAAARSIDAFANGGCRFIVI